MPLFLRITPRSARERLNGALYAFELSEEQLREQVIIPYERGEALVIGGRVLASDDITSIEITEATDNVAGYPLDDLRPEWTHGNRRRMGDWLAQHATNVSDRYINGPPGSRAEGLQEADPAPGEPRSGEAISIPRPLQAAYWALGVVVSIIVLATTPAWIAGAAIGFIVGVGLLHRRVWRWPPQVLPAAAVALLTAFGAGAGIGLTKLINPSRHGTGQAPSGVSFPETAGGLARTWSNYKYASGVEGPVVGGGQTVRVGCRVTGFRVKDGDRWWYRIDSSPWNGQFYVTADAFYNDGTTSGSLHGTPLVDQRVDKC
jgi:hypothetical protein